MLKRYGPLDWAIQDVGGGNYSAVNRFTGESITGNMSAVNTKILSRDIDYRGTPGTYVVADHDSLGRLMATTLFFQAPLRTGALPSGSNFATGKKIFTFPAGEIIVNAVSMDVGLMFTSADVDNNVKNDIPDCGIGTIVASGANAVLSANSTFENLITGQTMANCLGTRKVATGGFADTFIITAASSHDVFLNVANGWAIGGDPGLLVQGHVVISWTYMS